MKKEEMAKRLRRLEADNKNFGTEIKIIQDNLAELEEKPKHRHGDFGIEDGQKPIMIIKEYNNWPGDLSSLQESFATMCNNNPNEHEYLILGNIFDLLKEWSEDLKEYKKSGWGIGMFEVRIVSKHSIARELIEFRIKNCSATFTFSEAEEIWRKLGQMIATLKRRQK